MNDINNKTKRASNLVTEETCGLVVTEDQSKWENEVVADQVYLCTDGQGLGQGPKHEGRT